MDYLSKRGVDPYRWFSRELKSQTNVKRKCEKG
jgi:hypothetical protein